MMSELKAPEHGATPSATIRICYQRCHLDGHEPGAPGNTRERLPRRGSVSCGNACDMGSMQTFAHGAGNRRTCTELLVQPVWTRRRADARDRARIAGFVDNAPGKEWMERVYAAVDNCDRRPGAIESRLPDLIALDQRPLSARLQVS